MNNPTYIHKLNAQELGFRGGTAKKAGRYIYISKKYASFFPPLSTSIKNDHIILDLIPPESNQIVLTNYVYHNDKLVEEKDNGRNEFRLYFNEANDPDSDFFQPSDIVIIRRLASGNNVVYKLDKLSPRADGQRYTRTEALLRKYDSAKASHALVPFEELSFLSLSVPRQIVRPSVIPKEVKKVIFDEPIKSEVRKEEEVVRRIRSASFRDLVLMFYDYQCAITGKECLIQYGAASNLQAAHIVAVASGGGDNPSNGIPLVRDLHWAFDCGFFTIDKGYKVVVHDKVKDLTYLSKIHGKNIILPEDSRARPNEFSINWHNKYVFGNFQRK
jgi:hypothetical protein